MEDEVQAVVRQVMFLRNVFLRVAQDSRGQHHVARLVNAVYVTEGSGDGETRADFAQLSVGVINVFRLGIQSGSVHVAVVHAVFFAAGAIKRQVMESSEEEIDYQQFDYYFVSYKLLLYSENQV